jgi:hypothetical protein
MINYLGDLVVDPAVGSRGVKQVIDLDRVTDNFVGVTIDSVDLVIGIGAELVTITEPLQIELDGDSRVATWWWVAKTAGYVYFELWFNLSDGERECQQYRVRVLA